MKIFITLDYEIFFGKISGDAHSCLIEPTRRILEICDPLNIKLSVFVDVGYLLALKKQAKTTPHLFDTYKLIVKELKLLVTNGHDLQLHIHPHWEDSYFDGSKWIFHLHRYRLGDFECETIERIVAEYKDELEKISQKRVFAYRAGGWCIQPFVKLRQALATHNIFLDTTVFPHGYNKDQNRFYDFRAAPDKTSWRFAESPLEEAEEGFFMELPISSYKVPPKFFWQMVANRFLGNSTLHRPFGNGKAINNSTRHLYRLLTTSSYSVVSIDGFKAKYLQSAFEFYLKKYESTSDDNNFVIIGHPKAFTSYSLNKLKSFVENTFQYHQFFTCSSAFEQTKA